VAIQESVPIFRLEETTLFTLHLVSLEYSK